MNDKRKIEKLWYFDTEEDFSGRALELKRKVDLAYYNDYETIAKSPDWVDWTDSEDLEFDFLAKRVLKTYADRFILQASEYGISRYEKMLGLEDGIEESLEERRKRVYLLWNKEIRWTHRTILKWMDSAVGKGNYVVELIYNEYEIVFELKIQKGFFDVPWLSGELRKIIPANLLMSFRLYILDLLKIADKTDTYKTRYWMVNEVPCGRVPEQAYKGKKFVDRVSVGNTSSVKHNRPYQVNEIKSGGVANK